VKADEAKADEARDFKKAVEAKQRYLVKLLKDQGKYTSELSMQAKVVAQLLVRTDYLAEQVFSPLHKPVSVEVSREGNSREKVSEIETLYLKYSDQAQRALKALGMNTDSKERKTDEGSDSFTEFMKKMNDE
jgi:beta-lactam-binding protein with PASTA domain